MQKISEVVFTDESFVLVSDIIARLKESGNCDLYRVRIGRKDELRLAHIGPDANRKKVLGVFARILSTESGAALFQSKRFRTKLTAATQITKDSFSKILEIIEAKADQKNPRESHGACRAKPARNRSGWSIRIEAI